MFIVIVISDKRLALLHLSNMFLFHRPVSGLRPSSCPDVVDGHGESLAHCDGWEEWNEWDEEWGHEWYEEWGDEWDEWGEYQDDPPSIPNGSEQKGGQLVQTTMDDDVDEPVDSATELLPCPDKPGYFIDPETGFLNCLRPHLRNVNPSVSNVWFNCLGQTEWNPDRQYKTSSLSPNNIYWIVFPRLCAIGVLLPGGGGIWEVGQVASRQLHLAFIDKNVVSLQRKPCLTSPKTNLLSDPWVIQGNRLFDDLDDVLPRWEDVSAIIQENLGDIWALYKAETGAIKPKPLLIWYISFQAVTNKYSQSLISKSLLCDQEQQGWQSMLRIARMILRLFFSGAANFKSEIGSCQKHTITRKLWVSGDLCIFI